MSKSHLFFGLGAIEAFNLSHKFIEGGSTSNFFSLRQEGIYFSALSGGWGHFLLVIFILGQKACKSVKSPAVKKENNQTFILKKLINWKKNVK